MVIPSAAMDQKQLIQKRIPILNHQAAETDKGDGDNDTENNMRKKRA